MSLLPNRMQVEDPLPSLGQLVAKAISPVRDPIKEFETRVILYEGWGIITEKDCQQFKGAANPAGREVAPNCRPAEAAPPSKLIVTRHTTPGAGPTEVNFTQPKAAAAPFKPGDRVRYRSHIEYMNGVELVVSAVREGYRHGKEVVTRIEFTLGPSNWDRAECLELIPQKEEAKPSAGEWIDCSADMPDIPAGKYEYRRKYSRGWAYRGSESLRKLIRPSMFSTYQYCELL